MISSRDLRVVLRELGFLRGAKLENFYGGLREIYAFKFRTPGRGTDYVIADLSLPAFHASSIRPGFPTMPPGKILNMRKHIKDERVEYAYPEENERIVHIVLSKGLEIVVELFGGGNVILVRDGRILMALKYREYSARSIKPGAEYRLPPGPKPLSPDFSIERGLVRDLVRIYGVPPKYAREIAFRAGLPEDARDLSGEERSTVYEVYTEILDEIENSEGGYVYADVASPIELLHLGEPLEEYPSFNEALDSLYAKIYEERLKSEVEGRYSAERERLLKIVESQRSGLRRLREKLSRLERSYELLAMRLHEAEELLSAVRRARERMSREEIDARLREARLRGIPAAGIYESLDPRRGILAINPGERIELDLRKSAYENLAAIAEEIKRLRSKISRVEAVIGETLGRLEDLEARIAEESKVVVERRPRRRRERRYRYERFRRIRLEDALIVAGKDARTNEELIRKYMEPEDLVFHADYYGAPFVLLKGPKRPEYIREAALMAGAFSRARKDGLHAVSVFYVKPEQISLGAPHGQYVSRGAFVIRGKREYLTVELRRAVGENIRGSPERVKSSNRRIVVAPGGTAKEFAEARKIAYELTGYDRVIPAGSRIVERRLRKNRLSEKSSIV